MPVASKKKWKKQKEKQRVNWRKKDKRKEKEHRAEEKKEIQLRTFLLLRGPWEITNERWFRNVTVETRESKIEDTFHIYVICALWNFTCPLKCVFFQYFKCILYTGLTYLQYIFNANNTWQLILCYTQCMCFFAHILKYVYYFYFTNQGTKAHGSRVGYFT